MGTASRRTRMEARLALLAALVAALTMAGWAVAPSIAEPSPTYHYVALGDSYTAAPGVPESDVYAAGMAAPLFVLAVAWDRYRIGERRWLRGRGIRLGRFTVHTNAVLSAAIFIALGSLFLVNRGTGGLTALFTPSGLTAWEQRAKDWASTAQAHVPDLALLAMIALAIIAATAWRLRRNRRDADSAPGVSDR